MQALRVFASTALIVLAGTTAAAEVELSGSAQGVCAGDPHMPAAMTLKPAEQLALVCFKTGEQVSGMNRICYYNCAGSGAAITVSAAKLCPLSIKQ